MPGEHDLTEENAATFGGNFQRVRESRKILTGCGLAHFTQDGFTDMLYVFFPVWQAQFGLAFAQVGLFKMLFSGTLAFFQLPSSFVARRIGWLKLLLAGMVLTSVAVAAYGWTSTPFLLGCLLVVGGLGASVQHPISSTLISNAYSGQEARRTALSIFNTTGDVGKLVFPAFAALLIGHIGWPGATHAMGLFGMAATVALFFLMPPGTPAQGPAGPGTGRDVGKATGWRPDGAFIALLSIGILDSATRMGFLTYFPFLLRNKGGDIATTGLALSLIFAGGICGKFICGIIATRAGVLRTVLVTEFLTALCIWGAILLPLGWVMALCPLLGIALNGTSSVLYGSVPELVPEERRNQSFAVFYTATIGSGAVSPLLYGVFSDYAGLIPMLALAGALVLATLPLTLPLKGKLVH